MDQPILDDNFVARGRRAREVGMSLAAAHRMMDDMVEMATVTSDQYDSFWYGWHRQEHDKYLVDFLAEAANLDKSIARRHIVTGEVKVNDVVVDDVSVKLLNEPGHPSRVEYRGEIYPYYP